MDLSLHAYQACPIAISNRVENGNWLILVPLTRWRTNRKIISVSNRPATRYPMSQGAPVSPTVETNWCMLEILSIVGLPLKTWYPRKNKTTPL